MTINTVQRLVQDGDDITVWFSCGAASAVAAKKTIELFGDRCNVRVVNNPILEEHEDNRRFLKDVQEWLEVEIEIFTNSRYPNASIVNVFEKKKAMSFVGGAPCTVELKKLARTQWEQQNYSDWLVMGFTAEEKDRHHNFILNQRSDLLPILIALNITKNDCFNLIRDAGIKLPAMYELGYPNANCIGCVKSTSPTYWNHVRKIHPEVFQARAEQSRRLGVKLVRVKGERIFLDELDPNIKGRDMKSLERIECGIFCPTELGN